MSQIAVQPGSCFSFLSNDGGHMCCCSAALLTWLSLLKLSASQFVTLTIAQLFLFKVFLSGLHAGAANADRVRLVQLLLANGADIHAAAAGHNVVSNVSPFCELRPLPLLSLLAQVKGKLGFMTELVCRYVVRPWYDMQTLRLGYIECK